MKKYKIQNRSPKIFHSCVPFRETDFTTFETGFQGWEARNWGKVEYSRNTTTSIPNNITSNSNNNARTPAPIVPAPPKLENLNETNEVS
jgi:hypothetical protein